MVYVLSAPALTGEIRSSFEMLGSDNANICVSMPSITNAMKTATATSFAVRSSEPEAVIVSLLQSWISGLLMEAQ
jgi:hypothetical protein